MNLTELIEIARKNVQKDLPTLDMPLWSLVEAFDDWVKPPVEYKQVDWRGWIYHVPIPPEAAKIKYRDVKMDQSVYDYDRIVAHAVRRGMALLVNQSFYPFNPLQPMYERCRAMCAYVHSSAFNSPTVFLDGDAFVNADLNPIFKSIPDIAVTYRNDPGLMPINEGVIFANPTDGAKAFFRSYLATYEHLAKLPEIIQYYGAEPGIKRWRGGQLSLNALTCPDGVVSEMDHMEVCGARVQYLPCSIWNFPVEINQPYARHELDTKATLHLKGNRKVLVEQVIGYQNAH